FRPRLRLLRQRTGNSETTSVQICRAALSRVQDQRTHRKWTKGFLATRTRLVLRLILAPDGHPDHQGPRQGYHSAGFLTSGLMARPSSSSCAASTSLGESAMRSCAAVVRSEEHTSELQSRGHLVCRLLLEKK